MSSETVTRRTALRHVEISISAWGFSFDGETIRAGISSGEIGASAEFECELQEEDRLALIWMLTIPVLDGVDDLGDREVGAS